MVLLRRYGMGNLFLINVGACRRDRGGNDRTEKSEDGSKGLGLFLWLVFVYSTALSSVNTAGSKRKPFT